jgi:hypothetical protein
MNEHSSRHAQTLGGVSQNPTFNTFVVHCGTVLSCMFVVVQLENSKRKG